MAWQTFLQKKCSAELICNPQGSHHRCHPGYIFHSILLRGHPDLQWCTNSRVRDSLHMYASVQSGVRQGRKRCGRNEISTLIRNSVKRARTFNENVFDLVLDVDFLGKSNQL